MTIYHTRRILFVFAWLVVGGEETELRLLARNLNPLRYQIDVVACFRKPNMPEQTHEQLAALGIHVDKTPYTLSFEDTVAYLAQKIAGYDVVVACQAVPDVYPALERLLAPPPLIEHGGLVSEALQGPKHLTTRYVGVCDAICQAARSVMPGRHNHVLEIPSMVDLAEFNPHERATVRCEWGLHHDSPVIGWVGRLDRKKRVEDFIQAAALVHRHYPDAQFMIIGGADAFMPEYRDELLALTETLQIADVVHFLGDQPNIPRLLAGLDIFVWLAQGEGMPHVIAEAGAAGLPVIATADNGTQEQITHGETGLFVPHHAPTEVARTIECLLENPKLRLELGKNLRKKVEREYSTKAIVPQWEKLFEEVSKANARQS